MASTQDSQPFHWHYAELGDHDFEIRGRTLFFIVVLFAILLIFTLIFVYARWVFSCYRDTPTPTSHARPPPPLQPRGLDPATINALPITMVTRGRALESECCICLGVFEDGQKVKVLPSCHHPYHSECVDRWLSAESSCPLCRVSLRVESGQLHQIPVIVSQ
ncbi:RING-H2 finger protein ATL66-like [Durio zibethinus]|uniref:RING-type E3 ubiquitin transferase n=1 Tax=Durio zibethinus TaxID=66656 RepID=A0A6P6AHW8_DURZI|nr:RING-H2 finger protein ATL66-like [Durio zibethinus]